MAIMTDYDANASETNASKAYDCNANKAYDANKEPHPLTDLYFVKTSRYSMYVLACCWDEAKEKVENWLEKNSYGYSQERKVIEMTKIAICNFITLKDGINDLDRILL